MIPSLKKNSATVVASALLLSAISARAAFVPLPPNTPENLGVNLSGTSGLTGTVLLDQTVDFSTVLNPYTTGSGFTEPYTICFRGGDEVIPRYLALRFFAIPGTTIGPCPIAPLLAHSPLTIEGTLRSLIVDRGGLRDYYYQVTNTSSLPPGLGRDIFRMSIGGFTQSEVLSVSYSIDGLAGIGGAGSWVTGTKAPYSADRDFPTTGMIGIDFDLSHFLNTNPGGISDAPGNVDSGEASYFIVVRTNQIAPAPEEMGESDLAQDSLAASPEIEAVIIGSGAAVASAFTPATTVPEPATALLAGFGMLMAAGSRRRR